MADSRATTRPGRMEGKVCIVTGAGSPRGFGWATIKRFAEQGAKHIYALDLDGTNFSTLGAEFSTSFPNSELTCIQADVCDESAIQNICQTATRQDGRLDVFFANAGIIGTPFGMTSEELEVDMFMNILKNNVVSAFLAVKHAPKEMVKTNEARGKLIGSGSIIITASIAGLRGGAAPMPYSVSKAASVSLTQSAAVEFLKEGIKVRVNAIAPGYMRTAIIPEVLEEYTKRTDYWGDPISIANAALFLASDESDFVNGETLVVDNTLTTGLRIEKLFQV